jgi:8-oxo-dGTP diphosphatase
MTSNQSDKNVIFAAGGLLWKKSLKGTKVAIIHRTRYKSEWCLPKGKCDDDKDQTLEDTALREVEEETKCKARIITSISSQLS